MSNSNYQMGQPGLKLAFIIEEEKDSVEFTDTHVEISNENASMTIPINCPNFNNESNFVT